MSLPTRLPSGISGDSTGTGADVPSGKLSVGQRVAIAGRQGTISFLGETQFASGIWVGVTLDDAVGKNDGTIHDVVYFKCEPEHGIFVREKVCTPVEEAEDPKSLPAA